MTKEKRKPTKAAEEFEARPHMLWTHKKRVSPTSTTTLAYILSLALGEMGGRDGFWYTYFTVDWLENVQQQGLLLSRLAPETFI